MKSCNWRQLHFGARELCVECAGCRNLSYLLEQNDVCLLVTWYYMSNSQSHPNQVLLVSAHERRKTALQSFAAYVFFGGKQLKLHLCTLT